MELTEWLFCSFFKILFILSKIKVRFFEQKITKGTEKTFYDCCSLRDLRFLLFKIMVRFFWTGLQDFSGWAGLIMSLVFNPVQSCEILSEIMACFDQNTAFMPAVQTAS
jgi:hypothetical protein